jgi:hypothetical protein
MPSSAEAVTRNWSANVTPRIPRVVTGHSTDERGTRQPVSYLPEAILTQEQVARWLGVSTRTVRKLRIRRWASSRRLVRYLAKHVLEYLEDQAT